MVGYVFDVVTFSGFFSDVVVYLLFLNYLFYLYLFSVLVVHFLFNFIFQFYFLNLFSVSIFQLHSIMIIYFPPLWQVAATPRPSAVQGGDRGFRCGKAKGVVG